MGHHATYRKRGTAQVTTVSHPQVPPPVLSLPLGVLTATSPMPDNIGGQSDLYYSVDGNPPWTQIFILPWEQVKPWGADEDIETGYYYATNEGNAVHWFFESAPSNTINVA